MFQPRDEEEAIKEPLLNSSSSSSSDNNGGSSSSNNNKNIKNRNTESTEKGNAVVGDERTVGVVEIQEDEHLPGLPVEKYTSCVKFFFHFAKYMLALLVIDIVTGMIVVSEQCCMWWENESLAGAFVLAVLFLNVVVFFLAAKAIDRDVVKVDGDRKEGRLSSGEGDAKNPPGSFGMDCNNRENIYGRVARKIDVWLISACKTHRTTTMEPRLRPTGTSFLSHLCWILWALVLANSYADILELGKHQFYDAKVMPTLVPTTATIPPTVFSNITHFPKDLQQWIKSPQR